MKEDDKEEAVMLIDAFAEAVSGTDKDAIAYSYLGYKYLVKYRKITFFGRLKKVNSYIKDVLNGI